MANSQAAAAAKRQGHGIAYNLGALVLLMALLGLGLAYGIDAMSRAAKKGLSQGAGELSLTRSVGGRELQIPASWFRGDAERTGFAKQLDLTITLPLGPSGAERLIDITLLPRSQVRPSSSLLDGVYLHQFMPEQLNGPVGLIGKPLVADDGYEGETVWYDPLSANPFVAKCSEPVNADVQSRCIRSVYLGPGIAAVYGFGIDVLGNWKQFDELVRARLAKTGAL